MRRARTLQLVSLSALNLASQILVLCMQRDGPDEQTDDGQGRVRRHRGGGIPGGTKKTRAARGSFGRCCGRVSGGPDTAQEVAAKLRCGRSSNSAIYLWVYPEKYAISSTFSCSGGTSRMASLTGTRWELRQVSKKASLGCEMGQTPRTCPGFYGGLRSTVTGRATMVDN